MNDVTHRKKDFSFMNRRNNSHRKNNYKGEYYGTHDDRIRKRRHLVCFRCRLKGHALKDCPETEKIMKTASVYGNNDAVTSNGLINNDLEEKRNLDKETLKNKENDDSIKSHSHGPSYNTESRRRPSSSSVICFRCGSRDHILRSCQDQPQLKDGKEYLPFTECFICVQKGHLSSFCPENPKGIYIKGGGCHICESKFHLKKDCPDNPFSKKKIDYFATTSMDSTGTYGDIDSSYETFPTNPNSIKNPHLHVESLDEKYDSDSRMNNHSIGSATNNKRVKGSNKIVHF